MGDWGSTSWSFYQCLDTANHSVHLLVTADLWGILQFGLQRVLYTPAAITVPFVLLRFLNWHEECKTPIYLLNWHETNKRPYFLSHTHRHWTDNQICVVLSTLLYSVKNIFQGFVYVVIFTAFVCTLAIQATPFCLQRYSKWDIIALEHVIHVVNLSNAQLVETALRIIFFSVMEGRGPTSHACCWRSSGGWTLSSTAR